MARNLFTSASALAMAAALIAPPALAQDAAEDAPAATDREVIVVTASPIRDSQAVALEQQRAATNLTNVISADLVGRFPDQNLADSLGRVPGLAIERDQGQARYINFRGAPFRYTAIAFDGVPVLGAENGRIARFDSFPSVITAAIEANKATTPAMTGEAVAGFINIRTFNPFDAEGFRFSGEAGYGNQELGDEPINRYNLRASYSTDRWGAVIFGSHDLRGRITDNRELDLTLEPGTGDVYPNSLDFRSYRGERENNSYGGRLEFRPNGATRVFFSSLFSEFIDREERNQYVFDILDGAGVSGAPFTAETGYQPVVLVTRLLEDGRYRNSTWTNTLGADFEVAGWMAEARLNYTETANTTFLPIPYSAGGTVAASYDVTDIQSPLVTVYETGTMTPTDVNTLAYAANLGFLFADELDTEAWRGQLDLSRDTRLFGADTLIELGGALDTREAVGGSLLEIGGFPSTIDINAFVTDDPWESDFVNSIGGRNIDNVSLRAAWDAEVGGLSFTPAPDSVVNIEEDIYSAYAMATSTFGWGDVVYGARVEHTEFATTGNLLDGDTGEISPVSAENSYTNVLPSVHFNFDLDDITRLRLSATTGLSRPTYSESRASVSVDPIDLEATGGNPNLDAESTWGLDASIEWYYAPASVFSIGAFYRAIDNVIYPATFTVDGSTLAPGLIAPGTDTVFNSFANGEDGKIFGLEANFVGQATFLPYPFDGFGASGNITVLDSEFSAPLLGGETFSLPGASDLIYNASIFYENWGLSARLNYQYRDAWLSTTENDSLREYWDETTRLDASVRYTVPYTFGGAAVTLFANANNLTDELDVRYLDTPATPNQVEGFGRRFLFGVRVDY